MGIGTHITFKVHEPIKIATFEDKQELAELVEKIIVKDIHV